MDRYVRVAELASTLKKTRSAIYRLLNNGTLPGVKIGKSWVIPRERLRVALRTAFENALYRKERVRRQMTRELRPYINWRLSRRKIT